MSDIGLDGTPEGVADRGELAPDSAEVRSGSDRWRSLLIILPLVAGVFVAAAIGARMLLAEIPDPAAAETTSDVRCWDGVSAAPAECTVPSGRAGLRWVFPSFRPDEIDCRNALRAQPELKRTTKFECDDRVSTGQVTITYTEFENVGQGRRYLEKDYGFPPETVTDGGARRLLWTEGDEPGGAVYELDMMYAEVPFGVEVRAVSAKVRDKALDSLVRFRPDDELSVRP